MSQKIKRGIVSFLLFLGVFGVTAFADSMKPPMFMGEVLKVQKCEKETKLLVCGYLKGCDMAKTQMIVTCNKDTDIKDPCNKKSCDLKIEDGDMVCIALDKKITKSIPPQAIAKKIFVTKAKDGSMKKEDTKDGTKKREDASEEKTSSNGSVRVTNEDKEIKNETGSKTQVETESKVEEKQDSKS